MNDIVKYEWQGQEMELTASDVRNLISTSPSVTDKEIKLFLQLCKYQNLNPFVREAYLVKYGDKNPASIVVGKEVFTKRAENNPNFDGYEIKDNYKHGMNLNEFEVACSVYRKNLSHPVTVTVSYPEYVGTNWKGEVNRMWKNKPRTMLRKVALMQALREAFPTALGGLYEEHELDQRTTPKDITPKRGRKEVVEEAEIVEDFDKHNLRDMDEETSIETQAHGFDELEKTNPMVEEAKKVFPAEEEGEVKPATDKQKKYIVDRVLSSDYLKKEEKEEIGDVDKLSFGEADHYIKWFLGDKGKGIVGERDRREEASKKKKPKGKRDKIIEEIREITRFKQIPKTELKKVAGIGTYDTLMGCKIAVLEKVLEYCKKY